MSNNRSAETMSQILLADAEQVERLKSDPAGAVKKAAKIAVASTPLSFATDPWLYRLVTSFLGFTVLAVAAGTIFLSYNGGGSTPEALVALGSAAVGALAGLLAPPPTNR